MSDSGGPPQGFGKNVNDYLNHYVNVADAKAGAVLGAALTIAGLLLVNLPQAGLPLVFLWGAVVFFVLSVAASVAVVYPRTPSAGGGLLFWEDILSQGKLCDYYQELKKTDADRLEIEYAAQNWHVSRVLRSKYRWTRVSMLLFLVEVLLSAAGLGATSVVETHIAFGTITL